MKAKVFASFSGAMRKNLTAMMDKIGINTKLAILRAAHTNFHQSGEKHA